MLNVADLEEQIATLKEMVEEYSDDLMEKAEEIANLKAQVISEQETVKHLKTLAGFKDDEIANLKARLDDACRLLAECVAESKADEQATREILADMGRYLHNAIRGRAVEILESRD